MKNLPEIINDPELYQELEKAYAIAKPYRNKVLYRKSIINLLSTRKSGRLQIIKDSDIALYIGRGYHVIDASVNYVHKDLTEKVK